MKHTPRHFLITVREHRSNKLGTVKLTLVQLNAEEDDPDLDELITTLMGYVGRKVKDDKSSLFRMGYTVEHVMRAEGE